MELEMSTNREYMDTSFWRTLFPETAWKELRPEQYGQVFQRLMDAGPLNSEAAVYLKRKKIRLGFHEQYKSGAAWTLLGNITLALKGNLEGAYILSLIVHEAFHLRQSILMRLSMRGELLAWQHQERAYFELTGKRIGGADQAYRNTRRFWKELMCLSANSRDDLARAQELTRKIAPTYRSNCLPLFPLSREIGYCLMRGNLKDAFNAVRNLIACK